MVTPPSACTRGTVGKGLPREACAVVRPSEPTHTQGSLPAGLKRVGARFLEAMGVPGTARAVARAWTWRFTVQCLPSLSPASEPVCELRERRGARLSPQSDPCTKPPRGRRVQPILHRPPASGSSHTSEPVGLHAPGAERGPPTRAQVPTRTSPRSPCASAACLGGQAQSLRLRRAPVIVGKMPPERGSRAGPSQLAARRGHGHARLGSGLASESEGGVSRRRVSCAVGSSLDRMVGPDIWEGVGKQVGILAKSKSRASRAGLAIGRARGKKIKVEYRAAGLWGRIAARGDDPPRQRPPAAARRVR